MTWAWSSIRIVEDLKAQPSKMSDKFIACRENEPSRVGQDLHDSLGHTPFMLSVKTDLAPKGFKCKPIHRWRRELKRNPPDCKHPMNEGEPSWKIWKSRTLVRT